MIMCAWTDRWIDPHRLQKRREHLRLRSPVGPTVMPPSTTSAWPLTNREPSEAR